MADSITRAQIRGARAMLDWSMIDLARAAGVSVSVVKRVQDGISTESAAMAALQRTFEARGVRFLPDDGQGEGVRLKAR